MWVYKETNEGSISETLFQDQAGLNTVNTSDIQTRARMTRLMTELQERWNDSEMASNHTGTRSHLQKIYIVQDALCQCAVGYDTIDHWLWECGLHCTLRNELQEKLRASGIDHGRSIKDILAKRNVVAIKLIFEYSKDNGWHI
jgi:hypothetical protein